MNDHFADCSLCPRSCHVNRKMGMTGYCGCSAILKAARAGLHFFEEPFLSGSGPDTEEKRRGSGTVFFTGCNLGCIYCQNWQISRNSQADLPLSYDHTASYVLPFGVEITSDNLASIFLNLQERRAYNINLVTGTPYIPQIADALNSVRNSADVTHRLRIPVIWNSGGYESVKSLEMLRGLVDIWLPDLKSLSPELSKRYMNAPDYPEHAKAALDWMVKAAGPAEFYEENDSSEVVKDYSESETEDIADMSEHMLMKRGVCVRHLVIPGQIEDSKAVLRYLFERYGNDIWISLMSQYTPMRGDFVYPELNRKLSKEEYDEVVDYAISLGIEQCMIQEEDVAGESFIPAFDGTGIKDIITRKSIISRDYK